MTIKKSQKRLKEMKHSGNKIYIDSYLSATIYLRSISINSPWPFITWLPNGIKANRANLNC